MKRTPGKSGPVNRVYFRPVVAFFISTSRSRVRRRKVPRLQPWLQTRFSAWTLHPKKQGKGSWRPPRLDDTGRPSHRRAGMGTKLDCQHRHPNDNSFNQPVPRPRSASRVSEANRKSITYIHNGQSSRFSRPRRYARDPVRVLLRVVGWRLICEDRQGQVADPEGRAPGEEEDPQGSRSQA